MTCGCGNICADTLVARTDSDYVFLACSSCAGIEIYCAPTADARDSWQATVRHIAMEGGCFVLSANQFCKRSDFPDSEEYSFQSGPSAAGMLPGEVVCRGGSVIISPSGAILAGPKFDGEGVLTADLGEFSY